MAEKLFSFAAGAVSTVTGLYLANKVRKLFSRKPRMRLNNNQLRLSTRCTWLISELGVEEDFELEEGPSFNAIESPTQETCPCMDSLPVMEYKSLDSQDSELINFQYDPQSPPYVPAVVVNDEYTMIEGAAICMYLADTYNQFLPDQAHKAEYYNWIVYSAATFDNIMKTLQQQLVDTSEYDRDEEIVASALKGYHAFLRALSEALEDKTYLCGDNFTAADCVLGFTLWWAHTIDRGRLLVDHPRVVTYLNRLRQRPAFQKTFGGEEEWDWARYFSTYVRGYLKD